MPDPSAISLEDKYRLDGGRALISGRQALVRLPIVQHRLDQRRGLNTAGFISGYRGSPLGGYDAELWLAGEVLESHGIVFQPGVNEDLALTAVAGTQQLDFMPGRKVDGVFGIWYGKGPGVDRSGDAIKHANLYGVAPSGGVLLVFGDDHTGKSSTTAHQSDLTLASWGVPVLYPGSVAEILSMGLAAIAMSRFSGLLVGLKLVNETAESTSIINLETAPDFVCPDLPPAPGGVHIRPEVAVTQAQDLRLLRHKLPRAAAFARANRLDRIVYGAEAPRMLIATAGKAFGDVLAALNILGLDADTAARIGVGIYKIALIFPLDAAGMDEAAQKAEEVLFVEEKRPHAESQAKAQFYNRANRPRITGKTSPDGTPLLPADLPLDGLIVAGALIERLEACIPDLYALVPPLAAAVQAVRARLAKPASSAPPVGRRPAFCPGCPHNLSTQVPKGSFGATGIGCHGMVVFHPERNPLPMGHMGAEGAQWIGLSAFTSTPHIFQNLGDGTYSHSGSLAIRAAIQSGANITYKILFNDAVAMTGGQPVEGNLTVSHIVQQVRAEGVRRVVVVSERPGRFTGDERLPANTELRHRRELSRVQDDLRHEHGVSVIVYDQTCAAEKRRRRKIGAYANPAQRVFINALVCEGCGDCSAESNCLAIQPLETELGRKRKIDQSACNKDFTCTQGFCPSFVTVNGGQPRSITHTRSSAPEGIPDPIVPPLGDAFDLVIGGIGGTGVVTVSAVLGMAARIEGLGANLFDMTGLSQKGGQVFSHVRLRPDPATAVAPRVGPGEADVVLACDLIAAVQGEVLATIAPGKTVVIGNTDIAATADFQSRRDMTIPADVLVARLTAVSTRAPSLLAASTLSEQLLGDSIAANILMLGYAWQLGAIPLRRESIERAIQLNKKAVDANLKAFAAGRAAAVATTPVPPTSLTLSDFIARRTEDLRRYWNGAYARRYAELLVLVQRAAEPLAGGEAFTWAVARSAHKLMAYKDEYEVARLYSDGRFKQDLDRAFGNIRSLRIHLAPPLMARIDPNTGRPRKRSFGPWILPVLRGIAALRRLREGPLDMFAGSADRRLERTLRDEYLRAVPRLAAGLSALTLEKAVALARAPLDVRGFGPVKAPSAQELLERLKTHA